MDQTSSLAHTITRQKGIFTYFIVKTFVSKQLQPDCFKAYAYFRWLDDIIDEKLITKSKRIKFIRHQQQLIDQLYQGKATSGSEFHEHLITDLIHHHPHRSGQLFSFINKFLKIIAFDASRKGHSINQSQLNWYTKTLGKAVTDCIEYFIPPAANSFIKFQYHAATAATITHMLRDQVTDITNGYINIPQSYLDIHHLKPTNFTHPQYRRWVKHRVALARRYFHTGRRYINHLTSRRCRLAARFYCAKFEPILKTIEADQYLLKSTYSSPGILALSSKLIPILPQIVIQQPHHST